MGSGPVGVDLATKDGGAVAASTGTADDRYTFTVLDAAGAVLSNTSQAAPAGCTGPGFALGLGDPDQSLLLSCNTSDNLFRVPDALPESPFGRPAGSGDARRRAVSSWKRAQNEPEDQPARA